MRCLVSGVRAQCSPSPLTETTTAEGLASTRSAAAGPRTVLLLLTPPGAAGGPPAGRPPPRSRQPADRVSLRTPLLPASSALLAHSSPLYVRLGTGRES